MFVGELTCSQVAFDHLPRCLWVIMANYSNTLWETVMQVRFRLTRMGTCPHVTDLLLDATGPLQPLHTRVLEAGCEVNPSWKLGCPSWGVQLGAGGSAGNSTSFNLRHVGVPNEGCKTHNDVYVVCSSFMNDIHLFFASNVLVHPTASIKEMSLARMIDHLYTSSISCFQLFNIYHLLQNQGKIKNFDWKDLTWSLLATRKLKQITCRNSHNVLRNLVKVLFVPLTEGQMVELQGLAAHGC